MAQCRLPEAAQPLAGTAAGISIEVCARCRFTQRRGTAAAAADAS